RFAGSGRTDDERARARRDAATEELVELAISGRQRHAGEALALLGGDEARKDVHALLRDDEVMVAVAEILSPALTHAQPSPCAAVNRRELIEMNDAVRDAVYRAIKALGGEVVEHDHG